MQTLKMTEINKKGQMYIGLFLLTVIGIIAITFFVVWTYGLRIVNTNLLAVDIPGNITNVSLATQSTFSPMVDGLNGLKIIAFVLFLAYAIAIMITGYYSKSHPIMLVVFFLIVILMTIFSIYISNAYELLLNDPTFGSTFQEYGIANLFMLYLPYWVGGIGLIGAMLAVTGIYREQGGGI